MIQGDGTGEHLEPDRPARGLRGVGNGRGFHLAFGEGRKEVLAMRDGATRCDGCLKFVDEVRPEPWDVVRLCSSCWDKLQHYPKRVHDKDATGHANLDGLSPSARPKNFNRDPSPDSQNPTKNHSKNKGQKP